MVGKQSFATGYLGLLMLLILELAKFLLTGDLAMFFATNKKDLFALGVRFQVLGLSWF